MPYDCPEANRLPASRIPRPPIGPRDRPTTRTVADRPGSAGSCGIARGASV